MPGIKRLSWNVYYTLCLCSQTPRNGMLHFWHYVMWRKSCEMSEQRVQQYTSSAVTYKYTRNHCGVKLVLPSCPIMMVLSSCVRWLCPVSRPIIDNLAAWSLGPCVTAVDHRRTLDIPGCRGGPLLHGSAPATLQYKKSPENSNAMDNGKQG